MVGENLKRVRERIAAAARAAGRDPAEVRLICVTKGVPIERIREAAAAGVREIGENRVQEAQEKQLLMGRVPATGPAAGRPFGDSPPLRWHLIGRLQRNKAKLAAGLFDVVHSVDSPKLIETLERFEQKLDLLIQVNVSGEAAKGGCRPEEAEGLAAAIQRSKHLRWTGLMTMAPFSKNPEDARPVFRQLRELRDVLQKRLSRPALDLSMGMSGDFEVAVQEGATLVRIGTAIFGERVV